MDINDEIKKEALRRGYSLKTIKTYQKCVERFLKTCNKEVSKISKRDVKEFLYNLIKKERAGNTINVYLNALKFFFEEILNKRMRLNIKYSKKPKRLPIVLTKDEIKRLIESLENNYVWVREGKGKKYRLFIIAESIKRELQDYVKNNNINGWLFPGNKRNHLSQRTVAAIIKNATKIAKINKKVHTHTLSHSFATHLIENGYSVSDVQNLLGHNSPETTMIYLHTASKNMIKVKSPLDSL